MIQAVTELDHRSLEVTFPTFEFGSHFHSPFQKGSLSRKNCQVDDLSTLDTLPETNSSPLKIGLLNRKVVFQPSIFRDELLVSGSVSMFQFFSVPSHAKSHKVGWICCDPAVVFFHESWHEANHVSVFHGSKIWWEKPLCLTLCNMLFFSQDDSRWPKMHFKLKVLKINEKHAIRMMIPKGNNTRIRLIHFWHLDLHKFQPCLEPLVGQRGRNLRQYHPGILHSPHQPLKSKGNFGYPWEGTLAVVPKTLHQHHIAP